MPILHRVEARPRRSHPAWRRRVDAIARVMSAWLRALWRQASAPSTPDQPPPGPVTPALALRDGARLFDRDGEPIATRRVA